MNTESTLLAAHMDAVNAADAVRACESHGITPRTDLVARAATVETTWSAVEAFRAARRERNARRDAERAARPARVAAAQAAWAMAVASH